MVTENPLTKKIYRNLILRDLVFGSKSSLVLLLLYVLLWRVLYSITKIGQLRTNLPIFLGLVLLLVGTFLYIFVVYRGNMKKDWLYQAGGRIELDESQIVVISIVERRVFPLADLIKIKENKRWYFLYFQDKTFLPIPKDIGWNFDVMKPSRRVLWQWAALSFALVTIAGAYYVGYNAVNFNGALAWKINELKTDTKIKLENDNFYSVRLDGIIDTVKAKMELEPLLMTDDLEVEFEQDGTITEIYTYIYGFDNNEKLISGYLIYFDRKKDNNVTVHKQDWNGQGTMVYNPDNDLSVVSKMLEWIPIKDEVKGWNEDKYAVLYKGIRRWNSLDGIRFIDGNGKIFFPTNADLVNTGPSISLYVPGKEDIISPQRYVYKPNYREDF
jgi:hypothetical protein